MTTEQISRMNSAINKLEIEEGVPMKLKVGSIKCVKTYLEGQQKIVNSDGPGSLPAFIRVVEVMQKLKE